MGICPSFILPDMIRDTILFRNWRRRKNFWKSKLDYMYSKSESTWLMKSAESTEDDESDVELFSGRGGNSPLFQLTSGSGNERNQLQPEEQQADRDLEQPRNIFTNYDNLKEPGSNSSLFSSAVDVHVSSEGNESPNGESEPASDNRKEAENGLLFSLDEDTILREISFKLKVRGTEQGPEISPTSEDNDVTQSSFNSFSSEQSDEETIRESVSTSSLHSYRYCNEREIRTFAGDSISLMRGVSPTLFKNFKGYQETGNDFKSEEQTSLLEDYDGGGSGDEDGAGDDTISFNSQRQLQNGYQIPYFRYQRF